MNTSDVIALIGAVTGIAALLMQLLEKYTAKPELQVTFRTYLSDIHPRVSFYVTNVGSKSVALTTFFMKDAEWESPNMVDEPIPLGELAQAKFGLHLNETSPTAVWCKASDGKTYNISAEMLAQLAAEHETLKIDATHHPSYGGKRLEHPRKA